MTAIRIFFRDLLYEIPNIGISDIIDIMVVRKNFLTWK